jgi:hypothetical protein
LVRKVHLLVFRTAVGIPDQYLLYVVCVCCVLCAVCCVLCAVLCCVALLCRSTSTGTALGKS